MKKIIYEPKIILPAAYVAMISGSSLPKDTHLIATTAATVIAGVIAANFFAFAISLSRLPKLNTAPKIICPAALLAITSKSLLPKDTDPIVSIAAAVTAFVAAAYFFTLNNSSLESPKRILLVNLIAGTLCSFSLPKENSLEKVVVAVTLLTGIADEPANLCRKIIYDMEHPRNQAPNQLQGLNSRQRRYVDWMLAKPAQPLGNAPYRRVCLDYEG